ncbi:Bcr/CflA family efflux MFS transporter [Gracilibacillus alcaliphilus]|uniref:Bcr/CflA family efflux MFS transporter n=1 Tax=Gracilibacillus alcaliphilus TaxID=1401441 RepID=UPI001956B06B|nr:Bcr/CflA family efflux MFS transporter [Gracilibacillus alcaliphilus]MBM7678350.1 DHA1 family bicyclomycin/chloramphenicol resistance-like MFS transporter [Gracilibacillus alcaliphilus]
MSAKTKSLTGKKRIGLALLLALLGMIGPFNIDMYLPSFPMIADDFSARASLVQLSLTACLIGLAVGQLVIGPISDSMGRRKPLLIGLALFAVASLICAVAPNIIVLIIARFLQGFFGAAGIVLSRAMVRDKFSGRELTQFFALLMVINAVAPMVAPISGGAVLLMPFATWHTIFLFLCLFGIFLVALVWFKLEESLPVSRRQPASIVGTLKTMGSLLLDKSFIGYAIVVCFVQGGTFAYVAGTPFVYQNLYNVSPQIFSLLFGVNGLAIISGNFLVGKLSDYISERTLLRTGVIVSLSANTILLIMTIIEGPLFMIVLPIFIHMFTIGLVLTSSFSLAMKDQANNAGSASAILGMSPMLMGSIIAPIVGLDETTAIPMGAALFTTSLVGFIAFFTLTKPSKQERVETETEV